MSVVPARRTVTGHYAGPVSRALGAALDAAVVTGTYTLGYAALDTLLTAFFQASLDGERSGPLAAVALAGWGFLYVFVSLAIAGRTLGKSVLGLRVLMADGTTLTVRAALVRTLMLPVSMLLLGLGFVPIVLQREHRALHDFAAHTAVVYDWGARSAQLPGPLSQFLERAGR